MEVRLQNSQPLNINRISKNPVSFNGVYQQNDDTGLYVGHEVGTGVSTAISALLLAPVVHFFGVKLFSIKDIIPKETVEKVAQAMVNDEKNNFDPSKRFNYHFDYSQEPSSATVKTLKYFFSDHFNPATNTAEAHISRPSVILHEIGHGIDWNKSSLTKVLTKTRFWALGAAGILVPLTFWHRNSGQQSSVGDWLDKHIGTISFLSFVPMLITEASASLHGHKYLKQFMEEGKGVTADMIKNYDTRMKWAYGTYLATALLTPIAIKAGIMVKDKIVAKSDNQGMQQSYDWYNNQRY